MQTFLPEEMLNAGHPAAQASDEPGREWRLTDGDCQFKTELISFVVPTLLRQSVPPDERSELEGAVREELVRRVAAGI